MNEAARSPFDWKEYAATLLIVALLVKGGVWILKRWDFWENAGVVGQEWVHRQLASHSRAERDLPVVIVDIRESMPAGFESGAVAVPRDMLERTIRTLVSDGAVAIGVDVDFSPSGPIAASKEDPEFFDTCLAISRANAGRVPVVLGVARTSGSPREFWLGNPRWSDLAASIWSPDEPIELDEHRKGEELHGQILLWSQVRGSKHKDRLWSLSGHLAREYVNRTPPRRWPWWWAMDRDFELRFPLSLVLESTVAPPDLDMTETRFFGEYSSAKQFLRPDRVIHPSELATSRDRIRGKVVLIGIAEGSSVHDVFVVPGIDRPVGGVLVHAAGVVTLLDGPLLVPRSHAELVASVLIALVVGFISLRIAEWARSRAEAATPPRWLEPLATHAKDHEWVAIWGHVAVISLGILVCVAWVAWTRVRWDGFLLELPALALFPPTESTFKIVRTIGQGIWPRVRSASERLRAWLSWPKRDVVEEEAEVVAQEKAEVVVEQKVEVVVEEKVTVVQKKAGRK